MIRIALANLRAPSGPDESLELACHGIDQAAAGGAAIVCFPECFLPGYRVDSTSAVPDVDWLNKAWAEIDRQAAAGGIAVVLGTERLDANGLYISARVTNSDGSLAGFQDKVQLDPSEESTYIAGEGRTIFECGDLKFGVVICHEGWRYPETVRWAARNGAHVVFHPHFELVEDPEYMPSQFSDPNNSFHEKAALCRAAENTCYFASVNCALPGATTTSAVIDPEGALVSHQPYGEEGILFADINPEIATGFLAGRLKS